MSDSVGMEAMDKVIAKAKADGFIVIEGTPNTLLLDFDGPSKINEECLDMISSLLGEIPTKTTWNSKGGGTHAVLNFEKNTFTTAEAIAIEAALGSDPKRAALYILRLKHSVTQPRVLFMPTTNLLTGNDIRFGHP